MRGCDERAMLRRCDAMRRRKMLLLVLLLVLVLLRWVWLCLFVRGWMAGRLHECWLVGGGSGCYCCMFILVLLALALCVGDGAP